jgi:hypothetical protein
MEGYSLKRASPSRRIFLQITDNLGRFNQKAQLTLTKCAGVDLANDAIQTVEVEEARCAFLFCDFLNFDLLNQQSFMPLDISAWRYRSDRFACVIGAGDDGRAGGTTFTQQPPTLAAANDTVSRAARLITHLC